MPKIKYAAAVAAACKRPVFGPADLVRAGVPRAAARRALFRLARAGKARRVERGAYTLLDDPVAIAGALAWPGYLGLWTALSIRGLTQQVPAAVEVLTTRRRFKRRLRFAGTDILFQTIPARMLFGYEFLIRDGARVPVATPEKAVIDCLWSGVPVAELREAARSVDPVLLQRSARRVGGRVRKQVKGLLDGRAGEQTGGRARGRHKRGAKGRLASAAKARGGICSHRMK